MTKSTPNNNISQQQKYWCIHQRKDNLGIEKPLTLEDEAEGVEL